MIRNYIIAGAALLFSFQASAQKKSSIFNRIGKQVHQQSARSVNEFLATREKRFIWNTDLAQWDSTLIRNYVYTGSDLDTLNIGDAVNNEIYSREIYSRSPLEDATIIQSFENESWINIEKRTFTRDGQGYETGNQVYTWVDGAWVIQYGELYLTTYDGSGRLVAVASQSWNQVSQLWETYSNIINVFSGDQLSEMFLQEPSADGTLEDFAHIIFGYSEGSTEPDSANVYVLMGGQLSLLFGFTVSRWENFGDPLNFQPIDFVELESNGKELEIIARQSRTDLPNGGFTDFGEDYLDGQWLPSYRITTQFDNQENLLEFTNWYFNEEGDSLIGSSTLYTYTLDGNSNVQEWIEEVYDMNTSEYEFTNRGVFEGYLDVTSVELMTADKLTLFPNPTSNILSLTGNDQVSQISIIDVQGRIVKVESGNTNQIDVADLEAGLYFLQANINNQLVTKRFVKQ